MKKASKVIFSWVLAVIMVIGLLPGSLSTVAAAAEDPASGDIVILYTNDVHCAVNQTTDSKTGAVTGIGYAGVAAYKKEMEGLAGEENVTLVDAGDALQGDAIGTLSHGEYLVDIMKQVGYDVFVPGNHEFDYGMDQMQYLMAKMELVDPYVDPYLVDPYGINVISSNFTDLNTVELVYDPYTIISYGDTDVAFVGITTPESFTKSTPTYFQDENGNYIYGFQEGNDGQDLYDAVQDAVDDARAEGADYVVAVGHLGTDPASAPWRSTDVIAHTTGIDAFIDGHSHSTVAGQTVDNAVGEDVILTQTGTKLANIGRMVIKPDGSISTGLISGYAQQDPDTKAFIDDIYSEFADDLAQKVGETDVALTTTVPGTTTRIVRNMETNLGDLAADAYRHVLGNGKTGAEAGPADIAFVNGGGIRANIDVGDITFGEVIAVHPYNNVGCVVEATGREILDALEMGSRSAPAELGGFLQVSGLTYTIDTTVPSSVVTDSKGMFVEVTGSRRVKNVKVGGKSIDPEKTYTVASHNYMLLSGGDGINMFMNNNVVVQPVILDNQILISYIQDYLEGVVGEDYSDPYGQGRILILGPENQTAGFADSTASLRIRELARYSTGVHVADGGVQEIVTYNPVNGFSYSVNGHDGVLTAIDLNGLDDGSSAVSKLTGENIDVSSLVSVDGFTYGDMTSVAVSPDGTKLAAAIQEEDYSVAGLVAVFSCAQDGSLTLTGTYKTGVQPDMISFADNKTILTADEGEPRMGYTDAGAVDPKGSVTVVNLTAGTSSVVDFTAFDGANRDALVNSGVVLKKETKPSVDLEPEYIAVAGGKAYVTLQEASAVAVLDLASKTFTGIYSTGVQDYSKIAIDLDNSNEKDGGAYTPKYYENTYGLRMPDGIAAYQRAGKTYILTANEGDSREWADGEGVNLSEDEGKLTSTDGKQTNKKVKFLTSDYEGQPGLSNGTKHYLFGGRSFSMFEVGADGLTLVYDSGAQFEQKTAEYLPDYFNCSNDDVARDSRSNKKGPEAESVVTGAIGGRTYAFITLERIGGVMVYDVTDPKKVSYVNYINSRNFEDVDGDGIGNDDSAEGLKFIPASASPTGGNLLLAAFEVSGDVGAYALTPGTVANDTPVKLAIISDDHLYDVDALGGGGEAFEEYLANDRKMLRESEPILDEAIRRILASDADFVLISGDLTKDGEKVNHELLAEKLAALEQYGKQVFVINGNHDLSNQNALSYSGSTATPVDTVNRADFKDIYNDFGYSQAVARDSGSLSYAVDLGDDYRLIVMDAAEYNNDKTVAGRHQDTGGKFSASTLNWTLGQIKSAVQAGRRPIGMMHHGLVPHTAVQPVFFPEYLVDDYTTVSQKLADAGMGLVFTGHYHSQDVAVTETAAGKKLYDMETGSLVTYPSPIRYVTLDGSDVSYTSESVDSLESDEGIVTLDGITDFKAFAQGYLLQGLTGQVPGMLMAVNPALTPQAAVELAGQPVTSDLSLGQFLATSMAIHYAGDENENPTAAAYAPLIAGLRNYSAGNDATNALYRLLGNAAWALANDTTGDLRQNPSLEETPDNEGSFTLSALPSYPSGGNSGGSGGGSSIPQTDYQVTIPGGASVPVKVDTAAGNATLDLSSIADKLSGSGNTVIAVPDISGVDSVTANLPASSLTSGSGSLTLQTGYGNITVSGNMLAGKGLSGDAGITIGAADRSNLPPEVGDRPVVQLTLTVNGVKTDWNNPDSPVALRIPYTPTADERANPESIVIWYIDGSGNAVAIPNGHYDPVTGMASVNVTHFSDYAVAYNPVSFNDVAAGAWYNKAVGFIAARGVTTGTEGVNFRPDAKLTRGEYIVMLMKAYGIAPDKNPTNNFADAGNTYYTGYLAAAKRLGISAGVGNNLFAPDKQTTRQEFFTLLYNALKAIGKLPQGDSGKTLSSFSDAGQVNSWAKDALTLLVRTGTVSGSAGKLTPLDTTTRAEMAQVLYNLLSK